jgi:Zn-dependent peptidase ImmA (M78 family)/transcriptional regulator with XRE-family HTH domain
MPIIIGSRLRSLREELGLTQDKLAKALDLSGEFISLLELEKRTPSLETLKGISDFFQKDISYFLEAKRVPVEKLYEAAGGDKNIKLALRKFYSSCRLCMDFENSMGLRLDLAPLYTTADAYRLAAAERSRIGLGNEPVKNIFSLVERHGLHIFRQTLPVKSEISGVFLYFDEEKSAFSLINGRHSPGHQSFIAAHLYYHFLKDRHIGPIVDNHDVFVAEYLPLYHPREKLAHTFALHFLVPKEKVREIFDLEFRSAKINFDQVLYLKRIFGVSVMVMLYSLHDFGFLTSAQFKDYQKKESDLHEEEVYGQRSAAIKALKQSGKDVISDRLQWLVREALQKKKKEADKAQPSLKMDINES